MCEAKPPAVRRFVVSPDQDGQRLDVFLAEVCPDLSRSGIAADMSGRGSVQVAGRDRNKNFRLRAGQAVTYLPGGKPSLTAVAQPIPLEVVFEDRHLMVVDKPPGLVVHPAVGHPDGTLVNAILHRHAEAAGGDDPLRPGIVHRLDKDTSGLLVVALTEQAHRRLADQLSTRRMGRTYLALSWGRWDPPEGELKGDIGRHPRRRQQMAVVQSGRPSLTRYAVGEEFGFVQLCRVALESGRTHQIRVHFAHHGHPVVGDPVYGDDRRARGVASQYRRRADAMVQIVGRQMLHAAELRFRHPDDGRDLAFATPVADDMQAALDLLRRPA